MTPSPRESQDGTAAPGAAASALVESGDVDGAIALLRSRERSAADSHLLAWLERQRGEFDRSAGTMRELLVRAPDDFEARLQLGYAEWMAGELRAAESELVRVEREAADDVAARARTNLQSLREELRALAPVAAAARSLDVTFWGAIGLLTAVVLAATILLRRR